MIYVVGPYCVLVGSLQVLGVINNTAVNTGSASVGTHLSASLGCFGRRLATATGASLPGCPWKSLPYPSRSLRPLELWGVAEQCTVSVA